MDGRTRKDLFHQIFVGETESEQAADFISDLRSLGSFEMAQTVFFGV